MIIANPIYDVVFKFLMQDERIACFFISTLLQKQIEKVTLLPQERVYADELIGLRVHRFDFSAEVVDENGYKQNVLIEIQKAHSNYDLQRFRNYLAENYKKKPKLINGKEEVLPIFSIYILGFQVEDLTRAVVRINRHYFDLLEEADFNERSEFVEKLTHDSIVVQIPRLKRKVQNRIYKLLSIFEQENFLDRECQTKSYKEKVEDADMKYLLRQLEEAGADTDLRRTMEMENEIMEEWERITRKYKDKVVGIEKQIKEAEKQKNVFEKQKEEAEKQKEEAEKQKNEIEIEKQKIEQEKEIFKLFARGKSIDEISILKNISKEVIEKILEE